MFKRKDEEYKVINVELYSVYDIVAEQYGPIFQAQNDLVAQRNYVNLLADIRFKNDYELYHIGTFFSTGHIESNRYLVSTEFASELQNQDINAQMDQWHKHNEETKKLVEKSQRILEDIRLERDHIMNTKGVSNDQ